MASHSFSDNEEPWLCFERARRNAGARTISNGPRLSHRTGGPRRVTMALASLRAGANRFEAHQWLLEVGVVCSLETCIVSRGRRGREQGTPAESDPQRTIAGKLSLSTF